MVKARVKFQGAQFFGKIWKRAHIGRARIHESKKESEPIKKKKEEERKRIKNLTFAISKKR